MYAPTSVAVPVFLSDIFLQKAPYTAAAGWLDFGATTGPTVISRNITSAGLNIQQSTSNILEEITDTARTMAVPVGELRHPIQALMEESSGTTDAAASAGVRMAAKKTPFGSIFDLSTYRLAVIYRLKKSQGTVIEPTTLAERGRIAAWVGYNATLTSDNTQISIGEGEIVGGTLTFKLDSESTVTAEGSEQGFWIYETAGGTL